MEEGEDTAGEHIPDSKSIVRKFIAGGIVSSVAVTVMAPLERTKLILQVQHMTTVVPGNQKYKGVWDVLKRIAKEQGFRSFWRGNTASVYRCFPYSALNFSLRDIFRGAFFEYIRPETLASRTLLNVLAGGLSGSVALGVIYPLDFCRTRLALDHGRCKQTREYTSLSDCFKDTYNTNGIRGIYRGMTISIFGVFLYRSVFFGIYDFGIDVIPEHLHNAYIHFLLAETCALTGGMVSYPIDTVRRTLMMNSGRNPKGRPYKSSWDCAKHIYALDGIKGFFRGNLLNLMRGTGGTIMLILYEYIQVYILEDNAHTFFKRK